MTTFFIHVDRVVLDTVTTVKRDVEISVGTIPRGVVRSSPTKIKSPSQITCKGLWTSHPTPGNDDKLIVSITRNDKRLATVVLPLSWFPQNQVVSAWFPMKLANRRSWKHAPFVHIKVHYDTLGNQKFKAPRGVLTVSPAWSIPAHVSSKPQRQQQSAPQRMQPRQFVAYPQQYPQYVYAQPPQQVCYPQFMQYPPVQQQVQQPVPQPVQQQVQQPIYRQQIQPQMQQQQMQQRFPQQQPLQQAYFPPPQYMFANDADIPKVAYPVIQ